MDLFQQVKDISTWLRLFHQPGSVVEMRVIGQEGQKLTGGGKVVSKFFATDDLESLARSAVQYEGQGPKGIYFIPNPLRPEILGSVRSAHDSDVTLRRWLLIDIDSVRPDSKLSSTDAERAASWEVACKCRELLKDLPAPVLGDSGNGWHLNYKVDLPNDEASRRWSRDLLYWLAAKCGGKKSKHGIVDTSTHNASRIWKLYGTRSRKGPETPERPHRWSRIIEE